MKNLKNHTVIFLVLVLLGLSTDVQAQKKEKKSKNNTETKPATMSNDIDSTSYALGILVARNLKNQGIDSLNLDLFKAAVNDVLSGNKDLRMTDQVAQQIAQEYLTNAQKEKARKNIEAGKKYLEENKKKPGVQVTPSGLQYEVLKQGTGPKPADLNTMVTAHYHGTLIDGTVFDSSYDRNKPLQIRVNGVIKAWQEALMMMNVGTKLRIVCPPELAYGERGSGPVIGPNSVLIFEMELISIDS